MLIGAWGGLLADRIPKRRLLMTTQALMMIPALGLFAVTATGVVAPWMVYLAVFAFGSLNAVDNPTRQSFVYEMVGPDRVVNAVSLNSVIVQAARIVGPALRRSPDRHRRRRPLLRPQRAHLRGDDPRPAGDGPGAAARRAGRRAREPGAIRAGLRYVRARRS